MNKPISTDIRRLLRMVAQYRSCRRSFLREVNKVIGGKLDYAAYQGDPIPRYAEALVCVLLGSRPSERRNQPGWDAVRPDGRKVQIKVLRNPSQYEGPNALKLDGSAATNEFAVVFVVNYHPELIVIIPKDRVSDVYNVLGKRHAGAGSKLTLRHTDRRKFTHPGNSDVLAKLGVEMHALPLEHERHLHPFV